MAANDCSGTIAATQTDTWLLRG